MPNPLITKGTTLTCPIAGTYTRGNGGWDGSDRGGGTPIGTGDNWCIDAAGGGPLAQSAAAAAASGWNAAKVAGQNQLQITVPASAAAGTSFAAYVATDGTGAALTYWYVVFDVTASTTAAVLWEEPSAAGPYAAASFSPDTAGLLTDNAPGDAATGYTSAAGSSVYASALYDFGAATTITAWQFTLSLSGGGGVTLYGSADGTTWTSVDGVGQPATGKRTTLNGSPGTPINATYRLFQMYFSGGGPPGTTGALTDARLWDGGGNLVLASGGSASSAASYPARTASEAPTFAETAARGTLRFAARAALTAALLTQATSAGPVVHGTAPTTYPARVAVNGLLGPQTASRGPQRLAPRIAALSLLAEAAPSHAQNLPAVTTTETLLHQAASLRPRTFALRVLWEGVLFATAARSGRAAPAGTTAPPIVSFEPPLLTSAASGGPVSLAPRVAHQALFSQAAPRKPLSLSVRRAVQPALFTASGRSPGTVTAAPLPGAVDSRDPFVVLIAEVLYLLSLQGNPMSIDSVNLSVFDKIAASYRINELSQMANILAQLPTLIRGGDGVTSTARGYAADSPILVMLPAADNTIAQAVPSLLLAGVYRSLMAGAAKLASNLGFPSLDAYQTSLNTPLAPYTALVHPNFALISYLFNNQVGSQLLSPGNVFAPQTMFGMGTVGGGGSISYTDLAAIPPANVVNPTPGLSAQGYTAAPGVTANITTAINGTLTVTLSASGQTAAGVRVTGRTWTATLSNLAAGSTVAFTPAVAGDRISDVTACTGAGSATGGGFSLNSIIERVVS